MKLYEIPLEWAEIQDALEAGAGEFTPELEGRLAVLMEAAPEKIEAAAAVVRHLEAMAEVAQTESTRLSARAAAWNNAASQLRHRMVPAVQAIGKVKTARFTVYTTTKPSVAFELKPGISIAELPDRFVRWRDPELRKDELKAARKAGEELPPEIVVVEGSSTSLTIR